MRLFLLLLCAVLMTSAGTAPAQVDPDPNGIGIYYDTAATIHCEQFVPPGEFELYLVLTQATAMAGVGGWELRIEFNCPSVWVTGWFIHGWQGGFLDPPNFMQGLVDPRPWSPAILLMTMTVLGLNPDCCWFYIVPHPSPSIPGSIMYVDAADPWNWIEMYPSTGGFTTPVAGINCDCPPPVANEKYTWGGVKTIYR